MNKKCWIFTEYKNQKTDYPNNPFNTKVFYDFDEMKMYSAEVSHKNKKKYIDYCSDYIKIDENIGSLPIVLNSDYEQTIDELIKKGNNLAESLINYEYGTEAYRQWIDLLERLGR
jgi:hypothetical protein